MKALHQFELRTAYSLLLSSDFQKPGPEIKAFGKEKLYIL